MSNTLTMLWTRIENLEDMVAEFKKHRNKTRLDDDPLVNVEDCLRLLLKESKVRDRYD